MKGFPKHQKTSPLKQDLYFDVMSALGADGLTAAIMEENIEGEVSDELKEYHKKLKKEARKIVNERGGTNYKVLDQFEKTKGIDVNFDFSFLDPTSNPIFKIITKSDKGLLKLEDYPVDFNIPGFRLSQFGIDSKKEYENLINNAGQLQEDSEYIPKDE